MCKTLPFRHFYWLLILASCTGGTKPPTAKGPDFSDVKVEVMVAKLAPFSTSFDANGTLVAAEFVEIRPEVAGRLVKLNIDEGRTVQQGTLLAQVFNDDLLAQKQRIENQIDISEKTEIRLRNLLSLSGVNQQDYDQALTTLNSQKAERAVLEAQIRKTEIRAPFSGKLGLRNVSPGAYVSPADVLTTLQQTTGIKVDFVLPENTPFLPSLGDKVQVLLNKMESASARIIAIDAAVDESTRNIKFRALIEGSTPADLMPGRFVTVKITQKTRQVVMIPAGAIIPESRSKKAVLVKGGKAQFVDIETGYRGRGLVEITKGIAPGDTLAIDGLLFLKPGGGVAIKKVVELAEPEPAIK
jgi:membrane fusion protein (multidrug efflux system)